MKGIKEEYVSFETALLLQENGFDEECDKVVHRETKEEYFHSEYPDEVKGKLVLCPTQSLAMRWLREACDMHIMVNCVGKRNYDHVIQAFDGKDYEVDGYEVGTTRTVNGRLVNVRRGFRTYEEACEAAIKHCLTFVIG